MTEYLTKKSSGNYQLVNHRFSDDDIEVPQGAIAMTKRGSFYKNKDGCLLFKGFDKGDWRLSAYTKISKINNLVWQRESLNDKVASAEVARQELKGVDATLADRQSQYGSFAGVANTTGQLMAVIANSPNGHTMPYAHEEALHMICSKIARIMNGDINSIDGWHDIAGYATLIERIIGDSNVREKMD